MRFSLGTAVLLVLAVGSCAQPSDVSDVRGYAEAVESYVLDLERRFDRRPTTSKRGWMKRKSMLKKPATVSIAREDGENDLTGKGRIRREPAVAAG